MCVHTQNYKQNLIGTRDEKTKYCLNSFLRKKLFKWDCSANKPKQKDASILGANLAQGCTCVVLSVIQRKEGTNLKNPNSSCLIS